MPGKFGKTDVDKDANFQRYKKIQDKLKEQSVAEEMYDHEKDDKSVATYGKKPTMATAKKESVSVKKYLVCRSTERWNNINRST
jgi:hypothetical protein